jgi:hypothetical protein
VSYGRVIAIPNKLEASDGVINIPKLLLKLLTVVEQRDTPYRYGEGIVAGY